MDQQVFEAFSRLIEAESGIHLTDQKRSLLSNRIQKRLRALKLDDEKSYLRLVTQDGSGEELVRLIDVVSTNVTYFYREGKHFELLSDIFKEYREKGKQKIRVWSAACSSGEEPFTVGMIAHETLDLRKTDFKVLATDISTYILKKALMAEYEEKQLEKMPDAWRSKYLERVLRENEERFKVKEGVTSLVTFRKHNLSEFPYPLKGPLDIIFCRNVMIYFDTPLRAKIVAEFSRLLTPGGYLFVSHSENLLGIEHELVSRAVAVYRKQ